MKRNKERDPHGWNSFETYVIVHTRRMQDFHNEGFVLDDGLSFRWLRSDRLLIKGRIRRASSLFLDVEKFLNARSIRGRAQVRTIRYSYHAGIEGTGNRTIFRYDNFHAYTREGHPDAHHKHRFDHTTWQEIPPPEWIGEDGWPHLSDVLEELRAWWESTGQILNR